MSQQTCPGREELAAFRAGTLATTAFDSVARHLDSCPACLAALEQTKPEAHGPWLAALKAPPPRDTFADEPQCRQALDRAAAAVHQAVAEAEAPRQVDRYRLLERLGRGGMGEVYKARHVHTDEVVALKLVSAERLKTPGTAERFFREIKAQARLRHRHVVRAWDGGAADGQLFLVMDYAPGLSLDRLLQRHGRLEVADACEAARQAALGLQHAFASGLVHRDVKPSNLILTTDREGPGPPAPVVKILDLGLAKFLYGDPELRDELTAAGYVMGTADYMAPEQWADPRRADIRADLYSLGCTLYHLLAGRPPFGDEAHDTWRKKLAAHEQEPVPPVRERCPAVPAGLVAVLDRLLAKRPEDRFATPEEVAGALGPFCAGSDLPRLLGDTPGLAASTVSWSGAAPTGPRRRLLRRRVALLAGAAVLVLGVIAGTIFVNRGDPDRSAPGPQPPPAFRGSVDVLVLRKDALGQDQLLSLQDPRALPLAPGDKFRVEATVEPAAYVYLFWVNSAGNAEPLFPWEGWQEIGQPREERPASRIGLPERANQGFKFRTPGTGLETLVMLARATPLTESAEAVRGWFASLPDGRPLPDRNYRAWFEDFRLVKGDPGRRALFEREDLGLPAFRLQGALQPRLAGRAALIRAVSFAAIKPARQ
jgi:hypothetical protein